MLSLHTGFKSDVKQKHLQHAETHGSGLRQSHPGTGAGRHSAAIQGCRGGAGDTGTDLDYSDQGTEGPGWVPGPASQSY